MTVQAIAATVRATWRPPPLQVRHRGRQQGFTAIELVVAITILIGITLMISIIMARGDRIWRDNVEAARTRQAGRRVIELLTRDLEQSITDAHFPFLIDQSSAEAAYGDYDSTRLRFATLGAVGFDARHDRRFVSAVGYWIEHRETDRPGGFTLLRGALHQTNRFDSAAADNLYGNTNWIDHLEFPAPEPLAQHITAFRVFTPEPDNLSELGATYDSRAYSNRAPAFADLFLELLAPGDALQLARLPPGERQAAFIDQRAVRFTARIALGNRWGHAYRGR